MIVEELCEAGHRRHCRALFGLGRKVDPDAARSTILALLAANRPIWK